jgi:hypothetical protein
MRLQLSNKLARLVGPSCGQLSQRRVKTKRLFSHVPSSHADTPINSSFIEWLVRNGVEGLESIRIVERPSAGGRGIVTAKPFAAADVAICRVPLSLTLMDINGDESDDGLTPCIRLSIHLLEELGKGSESLWHPYLRSLPSAVSSPVLTYEYEDVDELHIQDGKDLFYKVHNLLHETYNMHCGSTQAEDSVILDMWSLAFFLAHSRTFSTAAEKGGKGMRLLCPLIDLVNHDGASSNCEFKVEDGFVSLHSTKSIGDGDELLLSYGQGNDDLLILYGFLGKERNANDMISLFPSLIDGLEWHRDHFNAEMNESLAYQTYCEALSLAAEEGGVVAEQPVFIFANGRASQPLLTSFAHLPGADAWDAIGLRCRDLLHSYPSTLIEDLELLSDIDDSWTELLERYRAYSSKLLLHHGQPPSRAGQDNRRPLKAAVEYRAWKKILLWDFLLLRCSEVKSIPMVD